MGEEVHTDPKDVEYVCEHCTKAFILEGMLKDHITRKHDRPFSCDDCKLTFGEKSSLKQHVRTHTNEKPFLCNKCEFRSSSSSALSMHTKAFHDTNDEFKKNKCDECGKAFIRRYVL